MSDTPSETLSQVVGMHSSTQGKQNSSESIIGSFEVPSFFEITMSDQTLPGFKNALRFFVSLFGRRNERIARYLQYDHEMFAILHALVESHYVRHYDAMFCEYLYGMKRVLVDGDQQILFGQCSGTRKWIAIVLNVFILYFRDRFNEKYAILKKKQNDIGYEAMADGLTWFEKILLKHWSWFLFSYDAIHYVYLLGYLFVPHIFQFYSPLMHLQKTLLRRSTMQDQLRQSARILKSRVDFMSKLRERSGVVSKILEFIFRGWYTLSDFSRVILNLSIFIFKFLDWHYSTQHLRQEAIVVDPNIPKYPPPPPKKHPEGMDVPTDVNLCPICRSTRQNPTMIASSGYAFCYPCIHAYVSEYGECPITKIKVTNENLRRIFI